MPLRHKKHSVRFPTACPLGTKKDGELCESSEGNVSGELCSLGIPLGDAHPDPMALVLGGGNLGGD